jgi:hypothetical protein
MDNKSSVSYENSIADKQKKFVNKINENEKINFNSMYIEIMALFQQDESNLSKTNLDDLGLTNPEKLEAMIKPNIGINIINHIYVNKIKKSDYRGSTLGDIRHKYLTKLKEFKFKDIKKQRDDLSKIYTSQNI